MLHSRSCKIGCGCKEKSFTGHPPKILAGLRCLISHLTFDYLTSTLQPRCIQITKTGMYNLYFVHCDPNLKELVVEGKSIWKNPTGYLPGRMAPLVNFYGFMSLAFVILGVFWFSQYARFWKEVLPLQNCITLLITLGKFEMAS
ncbi:Transmembrane protein like [Actinidia chinensis var. chinensis]|uniref:Transmembrane protein like n=1 Tax=Actinidia chinensis var. chinensis TaxID=1590841 RepID=A0A2R6QFE4_ACTCC|nr:Transmembrane protein like [Actinidia chinensis var. chinensis]